MKMKVVAVWLALTSAAACFADYRPDRDGAQTAIRLGVVDTDGVAVPDAEVRFVVFTTFEKYYTVDRRTDADGVCEMAGTTRGEVVAKVRKDGYYPSRRELKYRDLDWGTSVAEHKWTRGVIENQVILKPVLNPRRQIFNGMILRRPPATNKMLPFDAFSFDWCPPYGKGKVKDFEIGCFVSTNAESRVQRGVRIRADNCVDGFSLRKVDDWCALRYALRADENADYAHDMDFGWVPDATGALHKGQEFASGQYLIFRIRSETNTVGKIIRAHYGIIGERLDFQQGLSLGVQVNPVNNDTSLEHNWAYRNMMRERGKETRRQPVD